MRKEKKSSSHSNTNKIIFFHLRVNDRIISANGLKLENVEYGVAVGVLRDSGPTVNLVVKRRIVSHQGKVVLNKLTSTKLKNCLPGDFGLSLQVRVFVREFRGTNVTGISEGDEIVSFNGVDVGKIFDFKKVVASSSSNVGDKLTVVRQQQPPQQQVGNHTHHQTQPSYDSSTGNLYVQPPTRRHHAKSASQDELANHLPPPPPARPPLPKGALGRKFF
jgi:hypothetical protein